MTLVSRVRFWQAERGLDLLAYLLGVIGVDKSGALALAKQVAAALLGGEVNHNSLGKSVSMVRMNAVVDAALFGTLFELSHVFLLLSFQTAPHSHLLREVIGNCFFNNFPQ